MLEVPPVVVPDPEGGVGIEGLLALLAVVVRVAPPVDEVTVLPFDLVGAGGVVNDKDFAA